ncbi:MAG: XRE family transcriptional regulator [Bordetella sp.]|nr:XRE family transcriptional regulator [Bordetella sp.]
MSGRKRIASPLPSLQPVRMPASARPLGAPQRQARSERALRVGEQIRALRGSAGLSGMALAQRACISRSLLSRIERGLVSASIETLGRIAGGLEVAMAQLFFDPDRRIDFSHVPPGRGILLDGVDRAAGHCHELLGHLRSDQLCVEPQLVRLDSTAQPRADAQRAGLEFVHVLRGAVRFRYGARVLSAQAGDSLLFEAGAPHGIEAIIDAPVSYLSLTVTLRE